MADATIICPRCGRTEAADSPFCYCGFIFSKTSSTLDPPPASYSIDMAAPLPCPICGKETTSLKVFVFTRTMLFLFIYVMFWEAQFVACPSCMRRILRQRLLANIPTAHFLWPALLLIYIPRFAATYEPGHRLGMSQAAEIKPPGPISSFFQRLGRFLNEIGDHSLQYIGLVVAVVCAASLAFSRRHDLFDSSRIVFYIFSGLLLCRFGADVRRSAK